MNIEAIIILMIELKTFGSVSLIIDFLNIYKMFKFKPKYRNR